MVEETFIALLRSLVAIYVVIYRLGFFFFLPFVFGATADGCVHNSSKLNVAGSERSLARNALLG